MGGAGTIAIKYLSGDLTTGNVLECTAPRVRFGLQLQHIDGGVDMGGTCLGHIYSRRSKEYTHQTLMELFPVQTNARVSQVKPKRKPI